MWVGHAMFNAKFAENEVCDVLISYRASRELHHQNSCSLPLGFAHTVTSVTSDSVVTSIDHRT